MLGCFVLAGSVAVAEKGQGGEKQGKRSPEKMFNRMDADDSGGVSLAEFTTAHERRLEKMKEKGKEPKDGREIPPADQIFSRIDTNGDDSISLEEFVEHVKNRKRGKGKS